MGKKIIIYQVFTRLLTNRNMTRKEWGTVAENGCGKFNDFTPEVLKMIKDKGVTHIWYTGVIRHATVTDYSKYGIPRNHPEVIKGRAGSPYAIVDYYDVDPDLAQDVNKRMEEYEALIVRTHKSGLKIIMDFVPNHVGREYHSICKPEGVRDLGEDDDKNMNFSPRNNFYYCGGEPLHVPNTPNTGIAQYTADGDFRPYEEIPAKATGNDHFDAWPGVNDWYETVKLNYGVDYCDAGGRSYHFDPIPDTWVKMRDILMFWASKGVDGFRCDMAEMVPSEFWSYAISSVKKKYKNIIFIGEVYNPSLYETYVNSGFNYLYDKVGMYDTVRNVICGGDASEITKRWQETENLKDNMLYFLENHDEQRIASDFFAGEARKGIPGLVVSLLMRKNPFMLYAGQEYGERGMDKEGFSGVDGRTTIFDYWAMSSTMNSIPNTTLRRRNTKYWTNSQWTIDQLYGRIMKIASVEKTVSQGDFFDLMYVQDENRFDKRHGFTFLRKYNEEVMLVVANFKDQPQLYGVKIPAHALDYFGIEEQTAEATELLTGAKTDITFERDGEVVVNVGPYSAQIFKIILTQMKEVVYQLNDHNKDEFPPAHTAEHLLNQVMVRMFGCERSKNAHIERRKSKISYILDHKPSRQEEKEIQQRMNELIEQDLPVTYEFVDRDHLPEGVDISRLPEDASETIRIVRIGDFDVCPCIGKHVRSTSQIGRFEVLGTNWDEMTHSFRIRFKIVQ